jgi:hypothetical protein
MRRPESRLKKSLATQGRYGSVPAKAVARHNVVERMHHQLRSGWSFANAFVRM